MFCTKHYFDGVSRLLSGTGLIRVLHKAIEKNNDYPAVFKFVCLFICFLAVSIRMQTIPIYPDLNPGLPTC